MRSRGLCFQPDCFRASTTELRPFAMAVLTGCPEHFPALAKAWIASCREGAWPIWAAEHDADRYWEMVEQLRQRPDWASQQGIWPCEDRVQFFVRVARAGALCE